MMVPYMKKNHIAIGQNFLPLVKISFRAVNTESFSEDDSVMGLPVSSDSTSSMAGNPLLVGWSAMNSQQSTAITMVMTARTT